MPTKLRLIKTLWGIDEPISPSLFHSIRNEGYHGVEVIRLAWWQPNNDNNKTSTTTINPILIDSLNQSGLQVVCQIHTAGGYLDETDGSNNEYVYCGDYSVDQHKISFQQQLQECSQVLSKVDAGGFVNVHAGVDAWSTEEAIDFLTFCLEEIQKVNFQVTFETHRQRLFGSPFQTRELLGKLLSSNSSGDDDDDFAKKYFKLNADLSHWYCACERVFDDSQKRDAPWWPSLLDNLVGPNCYYIHARLGWAQGPQMADPSAPECQVERDLQINIWKRLYKSMQERHDNSGRKEPQIFCYMSPEYGPYPYLPIHPHSQKPVAELAAAVEYTKNLLRSLFGS